MIETKFLVVIFLCLVCLVLVNVAFRVIGTDHKHSPVAMTLLSICSVSGFAMAAIAQV